MHVRLSHVRHVFFVLRKARVELAPDQITLSGIPFLLVRNHSSEVREHGFQFHYNRIAYPALCVVDLEQELHLLTLLKGVFTAGFELTCRLNYQGQNAYLICPLCRGVLHRFRNFAKTNSNIKIGTAAAVPIINECYYRG